MTHEDIKKSIDLFLEKIGISFHNHKLIQTAFTHRSYVNEHKGELIEHNERLEFLGDAVLELIVTRFLFEKYPHKPEGELTAYRSALVNTNTISDAATKLGMNDCLFLSRGESRDTGKARQYILADTFESVLGAIYLDQGYDAAHSFVEKNIFPLADVVVEKRLWQDSKSHFQEKAQERVSITPHYAIIHETGPDHDKQFTVGVYLHGNEIAQGQGKSKQEAEQRAAAAALLVKGWS